MKKTSKVKRIAALAAVVVLVGLIVASLIAALLGKPYASGLLMSTLAVPIILYAVMMVTRVLGGSNKEDGMSLNEIRKLKNESKKSEKEEK